MAILMNQTTAVNLIPGTILPVVNVSQYDTGRQLTFTIYNGSTPFAIPDGSTVTFYELKTDGNGVAVDMSISSTSYQCYVWMTSQMAPVAGDQMCEIVITNSDSRRIGTINFILRVEPVAVPADTSFSDSDISTAQSVLNRIESVSAYEARLSDVEFQMDTKAPIDHASATGEYGTGSSTQYGHLKLWSSLLSAPSGSGFAMEATNVVNWYSDMATIAYYPGTASSPGWMFGDSFSQDDSKLYCRRTARGVYQITFAARVKTAIAAGKDRYIVTNLPAASMRTYVQAVVVTYTTSGSTSTPSAITPIMCAIRPENELSYSNQILQVDGATNPNAIASGSTIYGSFTYISAVYG